ncbi:MAG TPA: hypothetical protein DCE42_20060 [Myxococcales bacterium]|nr:hypothetical protein [Myxococcales bacterium]
MYGCFISHWRHPLDLSHEHTTKAINEGMELGVFSNAGWATMNIPWQAFSRGTDLPSILQETETFLDLARNTFKYDDAVSIFLISQHVTLDLMGAESLKAQLLSQGHIEEDLFAALSHYPMALFPLYTIKLQAASIMDDNEKIEQALEKAQELVPLAPGLPQQVDFVFYHSLHMTKQFSDADEETQASYNEQLNEALAKLQNWADNSPTNHQYKALLVEAEILSNQLQQETSNAAIEQRAAELYEQAIEHSQTHNILHGEGLCLERAARFYTLRKKSRTALGYLTDARHAYARWGARKKVLQMERVNPVLRVQQSQLSSTLRSMSFDSTTSSTSDRTSEMRGLLDLRSIQKTIQAISGEMKLEELLRKLLSTALENAGAQRGCLLLKDRLSLRVEASLDLETKEESILQAIPLHQASLPGSIIRFVERSRERLVLSDVTKHPRFGDDAYVKEHKTRSALCTPITHKNKLIGLLYLENNAIANVFHEERCLFLDIVAGQAAISIENAKLYGQLEDKVEERTKKLQDTLEQLEEQHNQLQSTQAQLIQVEKMSSLGTLVAGVAHELNNPANFTLNGAQNLARRLQKLKEFIFELAGDDADQEIIDSFEEKFTPLFKNLDAIANGAERIRNIVGGLRTFSRLDEAEQKRSHIIEGIKATIELVRANFSDQVTFEQHFEADPAIDCWPAQLNQVFMNLMVNACQAIIAKKEKLETDEQGRLKISTQEDDGRLAIRIQDNGSGMSKSVKEKIFEPFFTTRGVGEGTGLGLSISFGIIENHRGEIKVDSTPGIGTTFTIYLPVSKK